MPTDDEFRWAEALKIETMHGADAPRWIAERIASLAAAGDAAGVERLLAIAERMDRLIAGTRQ